MKIQKSKIFSYSLSFLICALCIGFFTNAYALNIDKVKVYFLSADWKLAILEGEKIIQIAGRDTYNLDELYYILALSYLKEGNYLRASDIFEIILREFKDSALREEAESGLADIYFLRNDYAKAEAIYKELIAKNPETKFKAFAYYRISQCLAKLGKTEEAGNYLDKLKQESPLNLEMRLKEDVGSFVSLYYTVQVGSFSNFTNANNLVQKLIQKGYSAYLENPSSQENQNYRVRVGKFSLRQEAADLEDKLSKEGYPTKIFP